MAIPACPGCGGSSWELVEDYSGGSKRYELRAEGWTLVDNWLELNQSDYRCRACSYNPSDGEDNDELWELLGDIDTAYPDETESGVPAEDALQLWQDSPAA